jgi:TorA maturation chaperone TorD
MAYSDLKTQTEMSPLEDRRDLYKILSECYYAPDGNLLENLGGLDAGRGGLFAELAGICPDEKDIPELLLDHCRLFVGPYKLLAPPYGSVFLEDETRVMGNSTIDARKRYTAEGLDIDLKEMPDHIAIELEFMYYLVFKQIQADENSESGEADSYLAKQKSFLTMHLGAWVSEFTDRIEAQAKTGFYRDLGRITRRFMDTASD